MDLLGLFCFEQTTVSKGGTTRCCSLTGEEVSVSCVMRRKVLVRVCDALSGSG